MKPKWYDTPRKGLPNEDLRTGLVEDPVIVSLDVFERMYEYSCSTPTGTIPGKYWKKDIHFGSLVPVNKRPWGWYYVKYVPLFAIKDGDYVEVMDKIGMRTHPLYVAEGVILGGIFEALGIA